MAQKGELLFVKIRLKISPLPRLALPSIEQKLDFVQLVFPPPTPCQNYFDKVNLPLQAYKAYKKFFKEIRVLVLTFDI